MLPGDLGHVGRRRHLAGRPVVVNRPLRAPPKPRDEGVDPRSLEPLVDDPVIFELDVNRPLQPLASGQYVQDGEKLRVPGLERLPVAPFREGLSSSPSLAADVVRCGCDRRPRLEAVASSRVSSDSFRQANDFPQERSAHP